MGVKGVGCPGRGGGRETGRGEGQLLHRTPAVEPFSASPSPRTVPPSSRSRRPRGQGVWDGDRGHLGLTPARGGGGSGTILGSVLGLRTPGSEWQRGTAARTPSPASSGRDSQIPSHENEARAPRHTGGHGPEDL